MLFPNVRTFKLLSYESELHEFIPLIIVISNFSGTLHQEVDMKGTKMAYARLIIGQKQKATTSVRI